jgi:hypothetical protein
MKNIDKRSNVICRLNDRKQFRVDGCIRDMVYLLNVNGIRTVGSCCGHLRYPLSIVYKTMTNEYYELISGVKIPRTRNFYKTDKDGFYYIPEALEALYADE